ncbi:MAG: FprA family A-type flavoprotein [Anaerolineales bacterium]|nr:FprA family A-type flavoprotein [Anaerolineales bacterium]
MAAVEIRPNVYWIGVSDRTTDLFEGIWPITQEGVTYNAYLINDDAKAIVDLAKAFKTDEFLQQIDQVSDVATLDYVVINHMEPDHSGILHTLRRIAPGVTILCSQKTQAMLDAFYGINDGIRVVQDGETISLGEHTLQFVYTPFVHWPETMMTYEASQQILFSCDAFGSYGALRGALFDDECTDAEFYREQALRYYVNIVALFSRPVLQAIAKLAEVPVSVVAPSHGLIWRDQPGVIIDLYKQWASYATNPGETGITLMYASMYGNTERMMNAVARGISSEGVPLNVFDVARTHISYILPSLWINRGVMVGAPTYEGSLFPLMAHALDMAAEKHIYNKQVARFGSYGWSGGAQRHFERIIEPMKWALTESFEFAGGPTSEDLAQGEAFGVRFAKLIKGG